MTKLFTAILLLAVYFTEAGCGSREEGYCVKPNNADQNSGVYKASGSEYWSQSQCVNWCKQYSFGTACELIWNQSNRGCYLHTQVTSHGNGVVNHYCWICNENTGSSSCGSKQNGYCVEPNWSDQNSGVYKAPGSNYWSSSYCYNWCESEPHKTGCEYIWNQSNRGCYVHTQTVSHGNNVNNHYCWICDGDVYQWVAVPEQECPSNANIGECSSEMGCNELCEADKTLPDGNSNYNIDNCGAYDIFRKVCDNRRMLTDVVVDDSMVLWEGSHEVSLELWEAEMEAAEGNTSEENSDDGRRRLLTVPSERKL